VEGTYRWERVTASVAALRSWFPLLHNMTDKMVISTPYGHEQVAPALHRGNGPDVPGGIQISAPANWPEDNLAITVVPRRLFFAAQQRIAVT
jgi:hypothetical protein